MMYKVKTQSELIKSDYKKLIKNFIVWSIIGYAFYILSHGMFYNDLTWHVALYTPLRSLFLKCFIPLNIALWFLPILFLVRMISNWSLSRVREKYHLIIPIVAMVMCFSFIPFKIPYLPCFIGSTVWGLFFFSTAYIFKSFFDKWYVISISFVIFIMSLFTEIPSVYTRNVPNLVTRAMWYPSCLCACIVFNFICKSLFTLMSHIDSSILCFPVIRYIGRNSMSFYVAHYIIFKMVFDIIAKYKREWYDTWEGLLVVLVCYATILPLVSLFYKQRKLS